MADAVLVSLNDLEGHSPVAGLFTCNPSNICAVFYKISTDSALARSSATAGLLVYNHTLSDTKCRLDTMCTFNSNHTQPCEA